MKYYTDPLQAAIMSQEFGVEYIKDNLCDEEAMRYWRINVLTSFTPNKAQLKLTNKHNTKICIHPDSYDIFKPRVGDLIAETNKRLGFILGIESDEEGRVDIMMDWDDKKDYTVDIEIENIIQRDGKPFFTPKEQSNA